VKKTIKNYLEGIYLEEEKQEFVETTEKVSEESEEQIIRTEIELEVSEEYIQTNNTDELEEVIEEAPKDETPWIFFDYSGTLVDTVNALANTYSKLLSMNFPHDNFKALYKDYPKLSKIAIMRKYKFNPIKFIFGGKKKFEEIRKEEFWEHVRAFPGIPEVLLRLKKIVNAKLAIATHETELEDPEERAKIFQQFGIPIQFDAIITDYSNKEEKFSQFINERGIQNGVFIGDTQFDLNLGIKHDLFTIGVTWGFSTQEEFTADYIIDDPREILQVVMNLVHQIEQKKLHGDPVK